MESATFGNAARGAFCVVRHSDTVARKLLDREDREALHWLVNWLDYAPARMISPNFQGRPLLLFSDGACEYVTLPEVFLTELLFMTQETVPCCSSVLKFRRVWVTFGPLMAGSNW